MQLFLMSLRFLLFGMWHILILVVVLNAWCVLAIAQDTTASDGGSVSGIVRNARNGAPIPGVVVSTRTNVEFLRGGSRHGRDSIEVTSRTDAEGRYRLAGLPPGQYRVVSSGPNAPFSIRNRMVTLGKGADLVGIDFTHDDPAIIRGQVTEVSGNPLAGVEVLLVAREYYLGDVRYPAQYITRTDGNGDYSFTVLPNRPYMIYALPRRSNLPAVADDPLDPKRRLSVSEPAFYGNTPYPEGAPAIVLLPGEERLEVDLRLRRTENYCVNAEVLVPPSAAQAEFHIETVRPSFGESNEGGLVIPHPKGKLKPDGRLRICGLCAGVYRLAVRAQTSDADLYGEARVMIEDRDVDGLNVSVDGGLPMTMQSRWADVSPSAPDADAESGIHLGIRAVAMNRFAREQLSAHTQIPGSAAFQGLRLGMEYRISAVLRDPRVYVKDIRYNGLSILAGSFVFGGNGSESALELVAARDAGTITVTVRDERSVEVGGARVFVFRESTRSAAEFAATVVKGETTGAGVYFAESLAPGEYLVLAIEAEMDPSTASVDAVWSQRSRAKKVELPPNGTVSVSINLVRQ